MEALTKSTNKVKTAIQKSKISTKQEMKYVQKDLQSTQKGQTKAGKFASKTFREPVKKTSDTPAQNKSSPAKSEPQPVQEERKQENMVVEEHMLVQHSTPNLTQQVAKPIAVNNADIPSDSESARIEQPNEKSEEVPPEVQIIGESSAQKEKADSNAQPKRDEPTGINEQKSQSDVQVQS